MHRPQRRKWFWRVSGLLGVLAAAGAAAVYGLTGRAHEAAPAAHAAAPEAVAVTVAPVTPRPIHRTVRVVGSLEGDEEITVSAKVEGRIVKIHHDVGDVVRPGEPLLELDPTDHQLAVAEATRALELELARLGLKQLPTKDFSVAGLPAVVRAAAQERSARSRRERVWQLVSRGAVSPEDRDNAEKEYLIAQADYRQALLDAEATLAAARHRAAALETARQRLQDATVLVPATSAGATGSLTLASAGGERRPAAVEYAVCERAVSEGEMVRPMLPGDGAALFRLVKDCVLKLQATVPERYYQDVQVGQKAELEVEAYPGRRFEGKVSRVNPSVDRASRTFRVEIVVANPDRELRSGSFTRVSIFTRLEPAAPTIPEEALVRFAGVTKVFAVRDGVAREVQVRPAATADVAEVTRRRTWVEVDGGLRAGDLVVTTGQSKLVDGTKVRVRGTEATQ